MTFQAPLFLLALALVPLAVAAYAIAQRRRRRYAVRYPALDTLASVLPRRAGWSRHLPAALFALALGALAVALARPETTVAVGREQAAVVLATDTSGSMQATDVAPDRMTAVKQAAGEFLDNVPEDVRVGAVSFSSAAQVLQPPTTDRDAVRRALNRLKPQGGTATGEAIMAALGTVRPRPDDRTPAAIVLLSDGKETGISNPQRPRTTSIQAAQKARELRVPVYTVALGTAQGSIQVRRAHGPGTRRQAVPPDPATLQEIARISGGRFSAAPNARDLSAVYQRLGSRVVKAPERQQVTSAFAGAALALLLAGALLSFLRAGRIP